MDEHQASHFRKSVGHAFETMDKVAFVSLTTRVCEGDKSLEIATTQVNAVEAIQRYLAADFGVPIGSVHPLDLIPPFGGSETILFQNKLQ